MPLRRPRLTCWPMSTASSSIAMPRKRPPSPPPSPPAVTTEPSFKEIPPMHRLYPANPNPRDSWDLLYMVRDLYSHRPGTQDLEPGELQTMIWSLNYTDDLLPKDGIAAAVEV